jgi:glycosyltransferase involved in cell wall biosynthesis
MSHMIPLFLVLAAPVARLRGVPLLLWYTHWNADRSLRVATRLADRIFSVDARSVPLATPKLQPTGHAIDVARFAPDPGGSAGDDDAPLRLLALGRMTPWKGYRTLLTAFEQALDRGLDATLEIRGPALTEAEGAHRDELERTVAVSPLLRDRVRVEQPVARDVIPELLRAVDALVSPTEPDGAETLDKVVYEAAACGIPVLSSNAALDEFLGGLPLRLRFGRRDPDDLAEALLALDRAPRSVRADVGAELRRRVVEGHSVDAWADQVVDTVARLRGARASGRGRE